MQLEPDVMESVVAAMQDPSRAVVTGYWLDHCTNVGELLDHRQYGVEIVDSQTVRQQQPTPRQPLPRAHPASKIPAPSPSPSTSHHTGEPHLVSRAGLPTPPPSVAGSSAPKSRGPPRKSVPSSIPEIGSTRASPPFERSAKRPRRTAPLLSLPRSNSYESIDTSATSASSTSSFNELRPTLRSDLSSVDGKARGTFLGIERKGSPPRVRKMRTWDIVDREEDIYPDDDMHLHLLADSLNIWIETHMPPGVGKTQAGWRKGDFLADLAESVSDGPQFVIVSLTCSHQCRARAVHMRICIRSTSRCCTTSCRSFTGWKGSASRGGRAGRWSRSRGRTARTARRLDGAQPHASQGADCWDGGITVPTRFIVTRHSDRPRCATYDPRNPLRADIGCCTSAKRHRDRIRSSLPRDDGIPPLHYFKRSNEDCDTRRTGDGA